MRFSFHCRFFCFLFFRHTVAQKSNFAACRLRNDIEHLKHIKISHPFSSIWLQIRNNHVENSKYLTFDFLIFKLGLLGSSGPLNQVLMLNDAILTATRFNSFFRSRLVSMIHKRSFLKEHPEIYCPLEVKRIFKIPADRIVTLTSANMYIWSYITLFFNQLLGWSCEKNICVSGVVCGLF